MKTEVKNKVRGAEAEMSHNSKLAQIKSGAINVRSTGGAEKKAVVTAGTSGAKFIINETEEKFEETGVTRKKKNYVMYEAKIGTEKTQDITKIAGPKPVYKPKPKPVREIEPRVEERIEIKKKRNEYLDNYQYHETKNIKNPNPRFQVVVEHHRLGDIIGGTFEETSYQRQVFSQGSNRPQLTEKTTTTRTTGTANPPALRGNKSAVTLKKTTMTTGQAPKNERPGAGNKKTTTTTTNTNTRQRGNNPAGATAKNEKITETRTKRRNEGTSTKTETKTETKTTTSGTRGGDAGSVSTTTKTTTRTTKKPAEEPKQSTTTTTKTTTRKTRGAEGDESGTKTTTTKTVSKKTTGDEGTKTETRTETRTEIKTETKTETKTEEKGGNDGDAAGASSIRKKYAKGRFAKP
jgi:hypothetical protein